jgi:DNA sulfur modification protein DndE
MGYFEEICAVVHLQPFALCKIAIALSLRNPAPLDDADFKSDSDGLELNRQTITGEYDDLFKALIISHCGEKIDDDEYFPKYVKAHIDRGSKYLYSEYKYSNNNFYKHLIELDKGI